MTTCRPSVPVPPVTRTFIYLILLYELLSKELQNAAPRIVSGLFVVGGSGVVEERVPAVGVDLDVVGDAVLSQCSFEGAPRAGGEIATWIGADHGTRSLANLCRATADAGERCDRL